MALDAEQVLSQADLPAIVSAVTKLQQRGQEFLALCPFHDDHNPSMSVYRPKGNGHAKWQYRCWSCGAAGDAADFLKETEGLDFRAALERLAGTTYQRKLEASPAQRAVQADRVTSKPPADAGEPDMHIRALGEPSRIWAYRDADGTVLGYVARYDTEEGKQIRCWTWGARGSLPAQWACGHWSKPRPLYGLNQLALRPGAPVCVVEGEKAADAAAALLPMYVVITWPGGAQAWKHVDWKPVAGREVLLWPDADEPGLECMERIAAVLADRKGLACSVKIIDPLKPGDNPTDEIPQGWDAANAQAEGWTTDQLIAWAKPRATPYVAPQQEDASESKSSAPQAADSASSGPSDVRAYPPSGVDGQSPAAAEPHDVPAAAQDAPEHDEPPDMGIPPIGSPEPPKGRRRRRKPSLSLIEGNTVRDPQEELDPLPASLSEDAFADEFAETHGDDWRCVKAWNQWLHWDGEAWEEDRADSRVEPMRSLYRAALYRPEAQQLTPDGRRKLGRQATMYASLRLAGTDARIRSIPEDWDTDPYMLGVPGGVIDLKTGRMIDSARDQHITMRASVAPENGIPDTWLSMLRYWQGDDQDVIGFIRRYLGYALTGDGREQCMAFFYGPAASGKGTIMRLVSYIMGSAPPPLTSRFRSYHYEAPIATFLESRGDRHSTELAAMHQKRLITSEEPAAGAKWDEAKVKWLTGGSFVTARYMRGDNFSFAMTGKLIVAANHRPRLATTDASIKRRLHVVPFEHPVSDEDRDNDLDAKLRAEAPRILHWVIEACLEWQQCGLGLPEKIAASTENYLQAEDVLAQWIDEACERDGDAESAALYRCYCKWAEQQGEKVWSRRAWANALVERGFKTRRGTAGVRMFVGLTPKLGEPGDHGYDIP